MTKKINEKNTIFKIFKDRHATGNFLPPLDDSQDCDVLWGSQNGSHTSVAFSRKWDTCDAKDDLVLGGDTVRAIWAYGEGDGVGYHGRRRRGSRQESTIQTNDNFFFSFVAFPYQVSVPQGGASKEDRNGAGNKGEKKHGKKYFKIIGKILCLKTLL